MCLYIFEVLGKCIVISRPKAEDGWSFKSEMMWNQKKTLCEAGKTTRWDLGILTENSGLVSSPISGSFKKELKASKCES